MSEVIDTPKAGWRMKVAIFALCVSIFAVLWFAVAALGTKFGFWPWQVGLGQMTIGVGPGIALFALGLSIVAQIIALIKAPRKQAFILALGATLIADDQTELYIHESTLWARAPDTIHGLIEARGVGLLHADAQPAPICVAVALDTVETERLPPMRHIKLLDRDVPQLQKVASPAWPAALAQYLMSGRSNPE